MSPIRIFIGYDPKETIAFHVLSHSIMRHASVPVSITGLVLNQLPLTRPRDSMQSTEFAFSRFLVPHLCEFEGWAIFMDCDMLCRGDIKELWDKRSLDHAVQVVKHDYIPTTTTKFLNQPQTRYARKNWSSLMIFNNWKCTALYPGYVDRASGLELHGFEWLDEHEIGGLPVGWNHLVGEYKPNPEAKLVHFTLGTPCFAKYRNCEFADEWFEERSLMMHHDRTGEFSKPAAVEP